MLVVWGEVLLGDIEGEEEVVVVVEVEVEVVVEERRLSCRLSAWYSSTQSKTLRSTRCVN